MVMPKQAIAFLTLLAGLLPLITSAQVTYYEDSSVQLIGAKDFIEKVTDSEVVTIVEFISSTCSHCAALAPTIRKLGDRLEGIIDVFAIDCTESDNERVCRENQIQGFPTLKIFPAEKRENPYTGKSYKAVITYEGPQNAKAIADVASAALPTKHIQRLESLADLEAFKAGGALGKVVLLSSKAESPPLYRSLSLRFKGRLSLAEVHNSVTEVAVALGAGDFPVLLVLTPEGGKVHYEGKLKAKPVIEFLEEHAGPEPEKSADSDPSRHETVEERPKRRSMHPVQKLDPSQLSDLNKEEPAWLVAFFGGSNETCATESAAWGDIVDKLGGLVKAGALFLAEGDVAAASEAYGLDANALKAEPCTAQLLLLPFGDKEDQDSVLYQGQLAFKDVQQFALNSFPSHVMRLTEGTLPKLLGLQPHKPKVVLITDKDVTPPLFAALSANFGNRGLAFFDVHSSQKAVLQQMGVTKVPAVVVTFLPPETSFEEGQEQRLAMQQYGGPLKYPALAMFMEMLLMSFSEEGSSAQQDPEAPLQAHLEIPEVATNAEFQAQCDSSRLGLCVILLLDKNAADLEKQLDAVRAVAQRQAGKPLRFVWVDAPRQAGFTAALGLPSGETQGIVAFSGSKLRASHLSGVVEKDKLSEFLTQVLTGKASTDALSEPPSLVDGGLDPDLQGAEAIEEEFDLAKILAEEVSEGGSSFSRDRADTLADVDAQLQKEEQRQREASAAKSAKKKPGKRRKKKQKVKEEL